MPHVPNTAIEEMLRNADPQSAAIMANILNGTIVGKIYCLSTDIKEKRDFPVIDDDGNLVYYKTGKNKGVQKTETRDVLIREGCKDRLIGYIYDNGQVEPVKAEDGNLYLRSTRKRLDGAVGCECWCGNDSRIALQEAGDIDFSGAQPTREGLNNIFRKVQKNPTIIENKGNRSIVDGFAFEEIA